MEITDEYVHDNKMLPNLVDRIKTNGDKIYKLLADGDYDDNDIFRYLSENGIAPSIKVRKNSRVRKASHILRNLSVMAQRYNLQRWKDNIVSYGKRGMTETVFSSIKRMFGEYVFILSEWKT